MDLWEHVPGGFVTVGILAALLVAVIAGFATKAIRLAAFGLAPSLALSLALGGWAFIEVTSERAEDALERAKDEVEKIEDRVEDKVDALR